MFGIYLPVDKGYFIHFQGLLYSFKDLLNAPYHIHIIDMGLTEGQIDILNKQFGFLKFEINKIDTSRDDKLTYRFKIKTIKMMYESKYKFTMMLDSKNHLKKPLSDIIYNLTLKPVLINDIDAIEKDWTHDTCFKTMEIVDDDIIHSNQYQSNNPVFYNSKTQEIMKEIIKYGLDNNCLCPVGSKKSFQGDSRHRQDQSVISLVLKKHNIKPTFWKYSNYHNTIHI